jgi:hypothetical protein
MRIPENDRLLTSKAHRSASYVVAMVAIPKQVLAKTRFLLWNHTDPSLFSLSLFMQAPFHAFVH